MLRPTLYGHSLGHPGNTHQPFATEFGKIALVWKVYQSTVLSSCIPLEAHLTPTSFVLFYPLESLINFFRLRYNSKSTKLISEAFQRII